MSDDGDLFDEFVVEAGEHLADIEEQLLRLEHGVDDDLVNTLFRAVHTIKGGSGFLGLDEVNRVAHAMEHVLDRIRNHSLHPDGACIERLLAGADQLKTMLERGGRGDPAVAAAIADGLAELVSGCENECPCPPSARAAGAPLRFRHADGSEAEVPRVTCAELPVLPAEPRYWYALAFDFTASQGAGARSILRLFSDLEATGKLVASRVWTDEMDLRSGLPSGDLTLEVLYVSVIEPEFIAEVVGLDDESVARLHPLTEEDDEPALEPAAEVPQPVPPAHVAAPAVAAAGAEHAAPAAAQRTAKQVVRVDLALLDNLMNLAGELVLVRNRQLQYANEEDADPQIRKLVSQLSLVTNDVQEAVMRTRMLEVGTVFAKLPRLVRDLAQRLHKLIRLEAHGNDVELDKTILEAIGDPLLHLVRNACDHGMDDPAARERAGKNPEGVVRVAARHEAGQIVIEIADDGPGIDRDKVIAKAVEGGLVSAADAETMDDRSVHALIMRPGFSTASEVTDVSGRGVGMDVVKSAIEGLGGSIEVDSEQGHGTTFVLRLPLTLAIISGLIVRVAGRRFAIPQIGIEEVVSIYREDIAARVEYADHQAVYRLRDQLLPLVWFDEVLASPEPIDLAVAARLAATRRAAEVPAKLTFVVIRSGSERYGLVVDEVLGSEDIVVKPMHPALVGLRAFSGSTILGDGAIALIADITGVGEHAGIDLARRRVEDHGEGQLYRHEDHFAQLVFEVGSGTRCALPLPLIRRVVSVTAADVQIVGERRYVMLEGENLLAVDVDAALGLKGAALPEEFHFILPRHLNRPVGILAHRIVDVVQRYPEPSDESLHGAGIIGSATVLARMTVFLDLFGLVQLVEPDWFAEHLCEGVDPNVADDRPGRILLVEDTRFFQRMVARYLGDGGHTVLVASNGREALAVLEEEQIDLVVCDIEMPVMDGIEFIRAFRRDPRHRDVPALALSALCHKEISERALAAGFDGYEVKIDREQLLAGVASLRAGRPSSAA